MRLSNLISVLVVAIFAIFAFSDSYSKRTDSPPGIVIAQNDMITHSILSNTVQVQLPISCNYEIAPAASPMIESERMVVAPVALLSKSQSYRNTSTSLKYSKSEVRKLYIQNIERFSGYIPKLC